MSTPTAPSERALLSKSLSNANLCLVNGGTRLMEFANDDDKDNNYGDGEDNGAAVNKIKITNSSSRRGSSLAKMAMGVQSFKWKRIQGYYGFDDFSIKKYTKTRRSDKTKWGKATTTVHASPQEVRIRTYLFSTINRLDMWFVWNENFLGAGSRSRRAAYSCIFMYVSC